MHGMGCCSIVLPLHADPAVEGSLIPEGCIAALPCRTHGPITAVSGYLNNTVLGSFSVTYGTAEVIHGKWTSQQLNNLALAPGEYIIQVIVYTNSAAMPLITQLLIGTTLNQTITFGSGGQPTDGTESANFPFGPLPPNSYVSYLGGATDDNLVSLEHACSAGLCITPVNQAVLHGCLKCTQQRPTAPCLPHMPGH